MDSLAKQGIKFTQHYSGSTVCGPSRASLVTGLHTGHSPIRGNPKWTASGKAVSLKKEDLTIAEMLKTAGYRTAAIGKWGLSESTDVSDYEIDPAMPNQQGFDYFLAISTIVMRTIIIGINFGKTIRHTIFQRIFLRKTKGNILTTCLLKKRYLMLAMPNQISRFSYIWPTPFLMRH
ncbi:sulfatase-like hydrolase/transferase [Psychrosphaera algicola]|uniref:sulfatase-like hydrolase/transferase n=1 Tax=Psychrosphaera algicola TaxID=3023714 RepID=UPI00351D75D9